MPFCVRELPRTTGFVISIPLDNQTSASVGADSVRPNYREEIIDFAQRLALRLLL